jgi:hypothetical protein
MGSPGLPPLWTVSTFGPCAYRILVPAILRRVRRGGMLYLIHHRGVLGGL